MDPYHAWFACIFGIVTAFVGMLLMADSSRAWGGFLLGMLAAASLIAMVRDLGEKRFFS